MLQREVLNFGFAEKGSRIGSLLSIFMEKLLPDEREDGVQLERAVSVGRTIEWSCACGVSEG